MFARWKSLKGVRGWYVWKLKLIDARLYFVSIFVGLLTGLVAVPYHYLLQFFFDTRRTFFDAHPRWYWHIPLFLALWGILIFVAWLVGKMPLITGGGIPQTRGVINGRISYKHPFIEMVSKFAGGVLALTAGLSLGREGPSVQIGSYVGCLVSKWTRVLSGERKQLLAAGAGAGLAAAFAAPLASSLLVIESIERFDAPKTAITTLLAGVVAGGVASWLFPVNPYHLIDAIEPLLPFLSQLKLFLLHPNNVGGSYDDASFCVYSTFRFFRIAGRKFHSYFGYRRIVRASDRFDIGAERFHRTGECELCDADLYVRFLGGRYPDAIDGYCLNH